MKSICFVTSTRADFGLLTPLIQAVLEDTELNLQLIVTGSHLSEELGYSVKEVESLFPVDAKIKMHLTTDSKLATVSAMSSVMVPMAETLVSLKPDCLVLLGDRYEIFATASVATILNIPIAHIHGGELTYGAYDDAFRHSITKMSQWHFTATRVYSKRVMQMGASPECVFDVGALGVEVIRKTKRLTVEELSENLSFDLNRPYALITYHPETRSKESLRVLFGNVLEALSMNPDLVCLFTYANADEGGMVINRMIDEFVESRPKSSIAQASLGQKRYLSALEHAALVLGNSSSGIIEAPSLRVPTVNIGDRQKGRERANSVIDTDDSPKNIHKAISMALTFSKKTMLNPYDKGEHVSTEILHNLKAGLKKEACKVFHDMVCR